MEKMQNSMFPIHRFRGKLLFNEPMSRHTSLKIGGNADVLAYPEDETDLRGLLRFIEEKGYQFLIIGAGSNLLVRDGGIRGVVLSLSKGFRDIVTGDKSIEVGAGVKLSEFLNFCAANGFSGFEFTAGIPGTIGGAVAMNAGAYNGELKDVVDSVEVIDRNGKIYPIRGENISFSYRSAALPDDTIVLRAVLRLKRSAPEMVKKKIEGYRNRRLSSQSIHHPNAGSIFKNPEGEHAGKLIELAGLKGMKYGGAKISEIHANYIVNLGDARANDVLALIALARDRVYQLKGILLEPEIKIVGEDEIIMTTGQKGS